MADFKQAYKKTNAVEGLYSDHPADRGGETWKGIARKRHPDWKGWALVDKLKQNAGFPRNLQSDHALELLVEDFYRVKFWDVLKLSFVDSQDIAEELYDTSVNMGPGIAGTNLQRILNVANLGGKYYQDLTVDGRVGLVTIKALNSHPRPVVILKALNCLQGARYITIAESNPSQETFVNGWFENRVNEYANR